MTLVVFDLDGTLLNAQSQVSPLTAATLLQMTEAGIDYTVATGRSLQGALAPLRGQGFNLPYICKNGVVIWCPQAEHYKQTFLLTPQELWHVLSAFTICDITPFVFTLTDTGEHALYHGPLRSSVERKLAGLFEGERHLPLLPLNSMPEDCHVINVSAMGERSAIQSVIDRLAHESHLVSYTGHAVEDPGLCWLDIHHSGGSKGDAVEWLAHAQNYDSIVVFGDGENDLPMFAVATESYAPANADDAVKARAQGVIGHHDEDGVAKFLRERFDLR
jgi:hypothetical protein